MLGAQSLQLLLQLRDAFLLRFCLFLLVRKQLLGAVQLLLKLAVLVLKQLRIDGGVGQGAGIATAKMIVMYRRNALRLAASSFSLSASLCGVGLFSSLITGSPPFSSDVPEAHTAAGGPLLRSIPAPDGPYAFR